MTEPRVAELGHPEGRSLSDFERSLVRLRLVGHEINMLMETALATEERKQDDALMFCLSNYGLILVSKFLEVWEQFNALRGSNRRVREIGDAIAPTIRRITRTWPRIKRYRHWALAHPYSIDGAPEVVLPWQLLEAEIAPTFNAEVMVLLECCRISVAGTLAYFGTFYRGLAPLFDVPEIEPSKGAASGDEAQRERIQLMSSLNEQLAKLDVDLKDSVFKEYGRNVVYGDDASNQSA